MAKIKEANLNWREQVMAQIKPGVTIAVFQKIREKNVKGEEKERVQVFEGMVLARKGSGKKATITVRKTASNNIGVERIFPLFSPNITEIKLVKSAKVRRAKLYYLRGSKRKLTETQL